jgi:hypothetical protein
MGYSEIASWCGFPINKKNETNIQNDLFYMRQQLIHKMPVADLKTLKI